MMETYLDLARQGKHDWWRIILAVMGMLFLWQIVGAFPSAFLLILAMLHGRLPADAPAGVLPGVDQTAGFIAVMLASVFFLLAILLAMRFIHRRPARTLVTPRPALDWMRILQGFGVWFGLCALTAALEALLHPGRYAWTFHPARFAPFLLLALVFIPIQTSAEELFFRGYILQGVGLRYRNIWGLCCISGLLFCLPHLLNPEVSANFALLSLFYFSFGFSLAYITLRDGRLELALGVHAANNLFSVLIANTTLTVLPSPSLFTINVLDAVYSVPAALLAMGVFIFLFVGPLRQKED